MSDGYSCSAAMLRRGCWFALAAAALAGLFQPATSQAQLTISTTGVLPAGPLEHSLILGDNLATLQAQWANPVNAYQQYWVNTIAGRANQSPSSGAPATFAAAALDSSIAQSAGLRYAMTGSTADLNKAVAALVNAALPARNSDDFITHPELLTSYLSAYDYIRAAPGADLSAATRGLIESRLLGLAQNLSYGNNTASNALGKIGATKALAGELLGNQTLLNAGLANLQTHYNYSTTDDGWFTDSQGLYLEYTLRHLALFARAYEQGSGVDLYAQIQPLLEMSIALRKPDGTVPGVSNGLNWPLALNLFSNTPDSALAGQTIWNLEALPVTAFNNTNIENNDYSYSTFFALTNFDAAPAAPTQSPTYLATGQSHVAVFRQDWSPTSDYLLLSAGVDSPFQTIPSVGLLVPAFHSSNDTAEVLVASQGTYILVGAGYDRNDLSNYPAGFQAKAPNNHNVILVDGSLGRTNEGRTMRPERFVSSDRLDSTERGGFHGVGDFSTLSMEYGGAQVARSIGFANEDYFVVADRMQAPASHAYGFNLIGRGTQTVLTNSPDLIEVKWEFEGQQVIEHLVSTHALSLATSSTYLHDQFNEFEVTQRMTATISAANAGFLSVIETGPAGSPARLAVTNLSTVEFAALRAVNASENYVDVILAQAASTLRT
ncbi:MAG: heparinase II/III family protein, partial [Planctomycetaceae bacterium]|nr:heparinase II/III family protein [Planctomycetaceae bacterium]